MKKIIISENQKGLLFRNGRFIKPLGAGKYYVFGDKKIDIIASEAPVVSEKISLDALLMNSEFADQVETVEVSDTELALHFSGGRFENLLTAGRYAYFKTENAHTFQKIDISVPEVDASVPEYIFSKIPSCFYIRAEVAEYQRAAVYFDRKLIKLLEPGTYYFWKTNKKVDISIADTRLTQMNISGQEMLTSDKVSLRINFVCNYKITDYVKIFTEIDDYSEQIRLAAQLALRDYIGRYRLDEILENKDRMSEYVLEKLKTKEKELYVDIKDAGVKDIILPGEIREIMNTVLVAEKRAQANVITRREEVASTRSLLNTAKMMEENVMLYKLKELEYIERICENVGSITLNGSGDMLTQLIGILHKQST